MIAMFKKLRNKFLIFGMLVTFFVMAAAFSAIYALTYNGIQQANLERLSELSANAGLLGFPSLLGFPGDLTGSLMETLIPSDYRPSFTLLLDGSGSLVSTYTLMDMPEEAYLEAAQKAWSHREASRAIRVNGRYWQYAFSGQTHYVIMHSGQGVLNMEVYQAAFLDVTESRQTLQALLMTFLAVGCSALILVFFICLFFANRAVRPVRLAWDAQKQFIADASHELKTPLTIIRSNMGVLLSKREETVQSQVKWLDHIEDGTSRMDKLIGDLLCLARAESPEGGTGRRPCNLSDTLQNEIEAVLSAAHEKGLKLRADIASNLILDCQGERFGQVAGILLDNAIKYSDMGGSIDIILKSEKHRVSLSVRNTGCGIPKEYLQKIFDRFYRLDAARTHTGGYGLGLSIAKAVVQSMGGEITAASDEGKSATFVVSLPMR